jgi:hypothetical protein
VNGALVLIGVEVVAGLVGFCFCLHTGHPLGATFCAYVVLAAGVSLNTDRKVEPKS